MDGFVLLDAQKESEIVKVGKKKLLWTLRHFSWSVPRATVQPNSWNWSELTSWTWQKEMVSVWIKLSDGSVCFWSGNFKWWSRLLDLWLKVTADVHPKEKEANKLWQHLARPSSEIGLFSPLWSLSNQCFSGQQVRRKYHHPLSYQQQFQFDMLMLIWQI